MKMNQEMARLLVGIDLSKPEVLPQPDSTPAFVTEGNSVFLREEYAGAKSVSTKDFPDRTGLESFVNHVHFPFHGDRTSLLRALGYTMALQTALRIYEPDRRFLVILSISDTKSTVRFHECRPNESWLADNLEGYKEEAILVLSA
jgi:hypothetical protein